MAGGEGRVRAGEGGKDSMTTGAERLGKRGWRATAWPRRRNLPHWPLFRAGPGDPLWVGRQARHRLMLPGDPLAHGGCGYYARPSQEGEKRDLWGLSILQELSHTIPHTLKATPPGQDSSLYFADEQTEAQRGKGMYLKPHS